MSEPLIHPLPIYPSFLSKADAIAKEIGLDPNRVIGGIVRLWLYAELNGERDPRVVGDAHVAGLDRYTAAELTGSGELVAAMESRGWLAFDLTGAAFPGLKNYQGGYAPEPPADPIHHREGYFDAFWKAFKAKDGNRGPKQDALRAWMKIPNLDAALAGIITAAAAAQSAAGWPMFHGRNPHARKWLFSRMWEDDTTDTTAPAPESSKDGPKTADRPGADHLTEWAEKMRQRAAGGKSGQEGGQ